MSEGNNSQDQPILPDEQPPTNNAPLQTSVNSLSMKIPEFNKLDPKLWFFQLECQFRTNRITSDQSKFDYVAGSLSPEVISHIYEIVDDPPRENKFNTVKEKLISAFADSQQRKTQVLLNELELGDQKPSFLLSRMRNLATNGVTDEFLRSLWLQRLPRELRTIVSTGTGDLNASANLADQIWEMYTPSDTKFVASINSSSAGTNIRVDNLEKKVESLVNAIEKLTSNVQNNNNYRSRSLKKNFPRSRNSSRSPKRNTCYYHTKFGEKANKCTLPCSMGNLLLNKNNGKNSDQQEN